MRTFSTPGVYKQEIDVSEILVPTGTSNGAVVIHSKRGPVNRPVLVTNNKEFIETFGEPIYTSGVSSASSDKLVPEYGYGAYAALEFLKESNSLYVVRAFAEPTTANPLTADDLYADIEVDYNNVTNSSGDFTIDSSGIYGSAYVVGDRLDTSTYISIIDDYAGYGTDGATSIGASKLTFAALGPGTDGNSVAVTIEPFSLSADWKLTYDEYPTMTTTNWYGYSATDPLASGSYNIASPKVSGLSEATIKSVSGFPIACQVAKINVFVKSSTVEWESYYRNEGDRTNGRLYINPVETFYGSLKEDLQDGNGNNLFIESVINGNSKYVYVKNGVSHTRELPIISAIDDPKVNLIPVGTDGTNQYVKYLSTELTGTSATRLMTLSGGKSKDHPDLADTSSWAIFEDRVNTNVNILIGTNNTTTYKQEIGRIAGVRSDAIATVQAGGLNDDTPEEIINAEEYGYRIPSYVAIYGGYSKIRDTYNDKDVYLPNSVFGAALFARVDNMGNPWDAPAGINRGILAVKDQRKIFSDDEIGRLYDRNINVPKFIRGTGNVMWGQKTSQMKASALDRINVRRNLLYIETNVERALLPFVFENNTATTRLRIFSLIDNFLAGVLAGDGLIKYEVVCDSSNNPPEIIDANRLNVDIYVQPAKTIEYIRLSTIVTRTGVTFESVRIANA